MAPSVDQFLKTVLRSGIVERESLQAALRTVPLDRRDLSEHVAADLVDRKILTPFQTQKLLAGISLGLKLGPYVIQTPIGKGGMGTVYLARDSRTNQPAAIKVVSPQRLREGQRHLARFRREMELSQKLRHPNVAMAQDVGEMKGVHYLALEYIPGVTLHRLVTRDGPLASARAARLFVEVCSALQHAHEQGLIHRDLKPTNIMVTPDDHAKVLDLGLAMMIGEEVDDPEIVGGKGYIVGSVEYIAPEQTRDPTQVDARADLYSLGCTMYFALAGRGPFSFGDNKDKVRAHRHQSAEQLRNRNPTVPEGFANLVHRLMAKDPTHRPASAAEVRAELQAFSEAPAPAASTPTDSAAIFEIIDEIAVEDPHDTLSEIFQFEGDGEAGEVSTATISKQNVRAVYENSASATNVMWFLLIAAAIGVLLLLLVVFASQSS
jgi:serine/threonine protein kinase